jgi:hypothetical protein
MQVDAIVFLHRGPCDYLHDVLQAANASNPGKRIVLLGDETNRSFSTIVEHHYISSYEQDIPRFEKIYLHMSENPYDFEFFCISRWFILSRFCNKNNLRGIFHADTDVLICSSISDIANSLFDHEAALSYGVSAHASFWSTSALLDFCEFVIHAYNTKDGPHFRELAALYDVFARERKPGGICDMTLINLFCRHRKYFELTGTILGGTFDHNINMPENGNVKFEMFRGIKKLIWINSTPYGRPVNGTESVRFHVLHCQGMAKRYIGRLRATRPPPSRIGMLWRRFVETGSRLIWRLMRLFLERIGLWARLRA